MSENTVETTIEMDNVEEDNTLSTGACMYETNNRECLILSNKRYSVSVFFLNVLNTTVGKVGPKVMMNALIVWFSSPLPFQMENCQHRNPFCYYDYDKKSLDYDVTLDLMNHWISYYAYPKTRKHVHKQLQEQ